MSHSDEPRTIQQEQTNRDQSVSSILANSQLYTLDIVKIEKTSVEKVFVYDHLITNSGSSVTATSDNNTIVEEIERSSLTREHIQSEIPEVPPNQKLVPIEPYYTEHGEKALYAVGTYQYRCQYTLSDKERNTYTVCDVVDSEKEAKSKTNISGVASISYDNDSFSITQKVPLIKQALQKPPVFRQLVISVFQLLAIGSFFLLPEVYPYTLVKNNILPLLGTVLTLNSIVIVGACSDLYPNTKYRELTVYGEDKFTTLPADQRQAYENSLPITVSTTITDDSLELTAINELDETVQQHPQWEFEVTEEDTFKNDQITQFYLELGYEHAESEQFTAYLSPVNPDTNTTDTATLVDSSESWCLSPTQE